VVGTITFSTWLTFLRVLLSPCVMVAIYYKLWLISAIIFMIAASTDFFDGYYARLYGQETQLGKILDPVADKILMFSTLISLFATCKQSLIPCWFVVVCLAKDVILVVGAYFLLQYKKSMVFTPSLFSKWITALFMIFLIYCMFIHAQLISIDWTKQIIVFFAISTILILLDYNYKFYIRLKE
jgi:cardiolipin synthase (CMP-forming)